jgi:hypothetical protein
MRLKFLLGNSGEAYFYVSLHSTPFVNKYVDELEWHLQNCNFNQEEGFLYFQPIEESIKVLRDSIITIKKFFKKLKIDIPEEINVKDQDFFNKSHEIFEKLSGSWGQPTRLFSIAPQEVKDAIRRLNLYIHKVEGRENIETDFYLSFDKDQYRRKNLSIEDYQYFQHYTESGGFYLHYSELGKTYYDLFKDNLPYGYNGTKNLHYYSGEANICLHDGKFEFPKEFYDWCNEHGIDYNDKYLGIGFIELGKVDNVTEVKNLLKTHQHLYNIEIERE